MSEGLAQGPFVVAGVGFEPATLWTQGSELTTDPPRPTRATKKLLLKSSVMHSFYAHVTTDQRQL